MSDRNITPKQKRFAREYVIDHNGTQAAIRAGYAEDSAGMQASRLIKNDNVAKYIKKLEDKTADKLEITAQRVLEELALLAFSNIEDYLAFDPTGSLLRNSDDLTRGQLAAISEITEHHHKDSDSLKFKLHDKRAALELIGKHLGMFVNKHELETKGKTILEFKVLENGNGKGEKTNGES